MKIKKYLLLLLFTIVMPIELLAQLNGDVQHSFSILLPNVSGLLKDSTERKIVGATITLKSLKDSIRIAMSDEAGLFLFKNIQDTTFTITIEVKGYERFVGRFYTYPTLRTVVLPPILLKMQSTILLKEVRIVGSPVIVYKQDTVEYKASDYLFRENDNLEELLKKAEGFEVNNDGTLSYQGRELKRMKLNGKEFAGGNVAQAIKNLPADIVNKFQVINDYGDQAARTGIREGSAEKILNVTTRADRSIGNMAQLTSKAGNDSRLDTKIFIQRLNANQELGLLGNITNTINGIANNSELNSTRSEGIDNNWPGTTTLGNTIFSYRDQWSKNIQAITSYEYSSVKTNSISESFGYRYSSIGASNFINQNTMKANKKLHRVNAEVAVDLNKSNYLQFNSTFNNTSTNGLSNSLINTVNNYSTGFEHVIDDGIYDRLYGNSNYGFSAFYLHVFKKPRRNFSIKSSVNHFRTNIDGDIHKHYSFYEDSTRFDLLKDSAVNLNIFQRNLKIVYETIATYVEPLTSSSHIEFIANLRKSVNNSRSTQDSISTQGERYHLTNFDQNYNFSITQHRLTANYRYSSNKFNFTMGVTVLPYRIKGKQVDNEFGFDVSASQSSFRFIPSFRSSYTFSPSERVEIGYTGSNNELNFLYIQPFVDRSDPRNVRIGNPSLKPEFVNSINALYNNYIANTRLNLSIELNAVFINDKITTNILQVNEPIKTNVITLGKEVYSNVNEIHFINLSGAKVFLSRYSISKQIIQRKFYLSLNGSTSYNLIPAMSNGLLYQNRGWKFNERLSAKVNLTNTIEIRPLLMYDVERISTGLANVSPTTLRVFKLAVEGKVFFPKAFQLNYSASKNIIMGISSYHANPFVLNASFQKELLKRRNLLLSFEVFDMFRENVFIQQQISPEEIINTLSNTLSRFFLIGLKFNLQKWSGTPMRNGEEMKRRGDGSFIY